MKNLPKDEIRSLLRLTSVPGLGFHRIRRLVSHFSSPSGVLEADRIALTSIDGIDKVLAASILKNNDSKFADEQIQRCEKLAIRILSFFDEDYPENLRTIPDPPIVLFVSGSVKPEDCLSIAVVGTRMPSEYGRAATERLTKELTKKGFAIISGLARGIDTIAHKGCLQQGGRTIAVLGSGLDNIYPPENHKLAAKIKERGAVVSEFPCGSKPDAVNFPKRNRIISGLSLGVLVTEAGENSGALITADAAVDQNREVFSLPGNILSVKSVGTNQLIKEGAKLVQTVEDIMEELDSKIKFFLRENPKYKEPMPELSDRETKVLTLLSDQPLHIDIIAQKSGFQTSETLSLLLTLELKELVRQLSGKMFVRC